MDPLNLSDDQLRAAWAHLSTAFIRNMKPEVGVLANRVNSARARIVALREADEKDAFR